MNNFVNIQMKNFRTPLDVPGQYQGGKAIIDRLLSLFGVRNRLELGDLLGVSPGTFATWQTRNTTPYELLMRIHLATGVPLEYLLFGESNDSDIDVLKHASPKSSLDEIQETARAFKHPAMKVHSIEYGDLTQTTELVLDEKLLLEAGTKSIESTLIISADNKLKFIDTNSTKPTSGEYLVTINDVYQLAEMKMLPDGVTYLIDDGEMFAVNPEATKVIGKVTGALAKL